MIFADVDSTGRVVSAYDANEPEEPAAGLFTVRVPDAVSLPDPDTLYWNGANVVDKPAQPSEHHEFNYATHKWELNPALVPTAEQEFRAARRAAYPRVEEQLDMLWHAMDRGDLPRAEPFYTTIASVKAAMPKPEGDEVFEIGSKG